MKLLFNPETQSIVMVHDHMYYDMRTGKRIKKPSKLPKLKPYHTYTKSKFETLSPSKEVVELDEHKVDILQNPDNLEQYQLGGYLPRYFWKGCIRLVQNGILHL